MQVQLSSVELSLFFAPVISSSFVIARNHVSWLEHNVLSSLERTAFPDMIGLTMKDVILRKLRLQGNSICNWEATPGKIILTFHLFV